VGYGRSNVTKCHMGEGRGLKEDKTVSRIIISMVRRNITKCHMGGRGSKISQKSVPYYYLNGPLTVYDSNFFNVRKLATLKNCSLTVCEID